MVNGSSATSRVYSNLTLARSSACAFHSSSSFSFFNNWILKCLASPTVSTPSPRLPSPLPHLASPTIAPTSPRVACHGISPSRRRQSDNFGTKRIAVV